MNTNTSCFLIISHTPSTDREFVLLSLLRKLKKLNYKVILATHTPPSSLAVEYSDYVIYDSNNELLNYYPQKGDDFHPKIFYNVSTDRFKIRSAFPSRIKYHGLAAASLLFNGLASAKMFGFEKCHLLEYDSDFETSSEFEENDILLDNYDSIHYFYGPSECMIHGSLGAFNLNSYTYEELAWNLNKERIKTIISSVNHSMNDGMVEVATCQLLHSSKNTYRKTQENFANGNVVTDLSHKLKFDEENYIEALPFMIENNVCMFIFFERMATENPQNIQVILNESIIHNRVLQHQSQWEYFTLCTLDELNTIKVVWNDKMIKKFDFINDIDKDIFSKLSRIEN